MSLRYKKPDGGRSKRIEFVLAGKTTRWNHGLGLALRLAKEGKGKDTSGCRSELIDFIELAREIGVDFAMLDGTWR